MEVTIFIGIQGSGKSSFFRERFFHTHLRINLDMLKTRHREGIIFDACLRAGQRCVIDNTNLTKESRERYILPARAAGFTVHGFLFQSEVVAALVRNARRPEAQRVPDKAIWGANRRLQSPAAEEGFDRLFAVRIIDDRFEVESYAAGL